MRIYWHETAQQRKEFTGKLLKWWIPLLTGGPESYTGYTYLAWADYLCVGEGYKTIADIAKMNGKEAIEHLKQRKNVIGHHNKHNEIIPDYEIPWGSLPPIQTSNNVYYYLSGRGCNGKCKFCMTSWVQPHQEIPQGYIDAAKRKIKKPKRLLYVTNDAGLGEGAGSTMLKNFLTSDRTDLPYVIRLGVEGLTEQRRRQFSKPMTDEDVARAIIKAREIKKQLELFFIVGFADDPEPEIALKAISEYVGIELVRHPRVYLKFTWFEPSPHTPMARWDLSELAEWDFQQAALTLRSQSGRYRVFPAGKIGKSLWSAIMRRCDDRRAAAWARCRSRVEGMNPDQARSIAQNVLGSQVIDGSGSYPWESV